MRVWINLKGIVLSLVFILMSSLLFGQQKFYRNSVQASVGFIPTISGFYERVLLQPTKGSAITFARIGYSGGGVTGYINNFYGQFGIVTNGSKHRFELALGGGFKDVEGSGPSGLISGNIGYRLFKENSRWMFRTGIGYPEFLYAGCGFRF